MSVPVEPSLFTFVDEFVDEIKNRKRKPLDTLAANSRIITFCEAFFAQFFANVLDEEIVGFDFAAKRTAAGIAIALAKDKTKAEIRKLVALFEAFCEMHDDLLGGYGGAPDLTYRAFHREYMLRLLRGARDWAKADGHSELCERITAAYDNYVKAVKELKW
jgi:hypothetical protein